MAVSDPGFAHLLLAERHQLNVVHDDELIQVGQYAIDLVGRNLHFQPRFAGKRRSQQAIALLAARSGGAAALGRKLLAAAPDGEVAEDVALDVEHEVPCAGVGEEVVDGVGDHSAQPAEAVGAADGDPAHPAQIVNGGSGGQRRYFHVRRVQPLRGQRSAVNGRFMGCARGFKHGSHCGGLHVCGKFGLGHGKFSAAGRSSFWNAWRETAS